MRDLGLPVGSLDRVRDGEIESALVSWVVPYARFSTDMDRLLVDILLCGGVGPSFVVQPRNSRYQWERVFVSAVAWAFEHRGLEPSEIIGGDQNTLRKRHRYAAVVTDVVSGCVVEGLRTPGSTPPKSSALRLSTFRRFRERWAVFWATDSFIPIESSHQ